MENEIEERGAKAGQSAAPFIPLELAIPSLGSSVAVKVSKAWLHYKLFQTPLRSSRASLRRHPQLVGFRGAARCAGIQNHRVL